MEGSGETTHCVHCGAVIEGGATRCPACGRLQSSETPPMHAAQPKRPTGVLVLAIVMLASCALSIAMGAHILKNMDVMMEEARPPFALGPAASQRFAGGVPEYVRPLVVVLSAGATAAGVVLNVVLACFLLKMRNWARVTTIVLYCLAIIGWGVSFLPGQIEMTSEVLSIGRGAMLAYNVVMAGWQVFVVVYLLKVGAAFRPRPVGAARA